MNEQKTLSENVDCKRCGERCGVAGPPGKEAKMLRFAEESGLCANCAVHDWLRNTYPINMQLAEYGPKGLDHPQIQQLFTEIMLTNFADAKPDEIDWDKIIENWDLPFSHKMKSGPMNPCSQEEIDAIKAGTHPGIGSRDRVRERAENPVFCRSVEDLNKAQPGLGDELKRVLGAKDE